MTQVPLQSCVTSRTIKAIHSNEPGIIPCNWYHIILKVETNGNYSIWNPDDPID